MQEPLVHAPSIPRAFLWRRAHSIAGIWLVVFLIQHLLTNSQAALLIGQDGYGFVNAVNAIHDLPYLPIIELVLLGFPIILHGWLGILYLRTGKINAFSSDGSTPSLPEYSRNKAYTWQRITSWLLLMGIIAHVLHMRFWEAPASAQKEGDRFYMVKVNEDPGLATLAERLHVQLFSQGQIDALKGSFAPSSSPLSPLEQQHLDQEKHWLKALEARPLASHQQIAVSPSFGTAELLLVRETFKMPLMVLLYTLFVIAACYHAFNGLWTFLITWGVTLSARSQNGMRKVAIFAMLLVSFLGLAAVWGTYWINLKN